MATFAVGKEIWLFVPVDQTALSAQSTFDSDFDAQMRISLDSIDPFVFESTA